MNYEEWPAVSTARFLALPGLWVDLAAISLLWLSLIYISWGGGNFPLNDDWCYAATVQTLVEEGRYVPHPYSSPTLLTQALWGGLFSYGFGFSYVVLRVSTVTLGVVALMVTYLLGRALSLPRYLACAGALALAVNPFFLVLAQSFMTDVPWAAFHGVSLLFLVLAIRRPSQMLVILAAGAGVVSILCRQVGLLPPVAFAMVFLACVDPRERRWTWAIAPLLAAVIAQGVFKIWMASIDTPMLLESGHLAVLADLVHAPMFFFKRVVFNLNAILLNLGLFTLPVVALLPSPFRNVDGSPDRVAQGAFASIAIFCCAVMTGLGRIMPVGGNVLNKGGLGPTTLRDVYELGLPHLPELPVSFWLLVTVGAVLSCGVVVAHIAVGLRSAIADAKRSRWTPDLRAFLFLFLFAVLYCAPIVVTLLIDRYVLPLLPVSIGLVGLALRMSPRAQMPRISRRAPLAIGLALGFSLFGVAGTHDYLAWNGARHEAVQSLLAEGVSAAELDGGYEINAARLYSPGYEARPGKSPWWVDDDRFIITMGPLPEYEVYRTHTYRRWLPPMDHAILALRRKVGTLGRGVD